MNTKFIAVVKDCDYMYCHSKKFNSRESAENWLEDFLYESNDSFDLHFVASTDTTKQGLIDVIDHAIQIFEEHGGNNLNDLINCAIRAYGHSTGIDEILNPFVQDVRMEFKLRTFQLFNKVSDKEIQLSALYFLRDCIEEYNYQTPCPVNFRESYVW